MATLNTLLSDLIASFVSTVTSCACRSTGTREKNDTNQTHAKLRG